VAKSIRLILSCLILLAVPAAPAAELDRDALTKHVSDTERAFAQTMADRDFEGFVSYLAEETVFFAGDTPLQGKQAVSDAWAPYYDGAAAPFSWKPELVVVLDSGTLALSSGPVFDPSGVRVATFNSIWRLESDGQWRIVFDKGSPDCAPPAAAE